MKVKLKNVRLAFPNLFEPRAASDTAKPKFSATFIFPAEHPATSAIKDAMVGVAKTKWGPKAGDVYKSLKAADKLALHDGVAKSDYAGFEGNLYINASNAARVRVLEYDGTNYVDLTFADGRPYAGCYVNGVIEMWAQDHPKYGKRINASLMGVQFVGDGERLAGGAIASEEDFEPLPPEGAAKNFEDSEVEETDPFA